MEQDYYCNHYSCSGCPMHTGAGCKFELEDYEIEEVEAAEEFEIDRKVEEARDK